MTVADMKDGCLVVLENGDIGFVDEENYRVVFTYNEMWIHPEDFMIRVSDLSEFKDFPDKTIRHGFWIKTEEDAERENSLRTEEWEEKVKVGDFVAISDVVKIRKMIDWKYNGSFPRHLCMTWKQSKLDCIKSYVAHFLDNPFEIDKMKQRELVKKYCELSGYTAKEVTKFLNDESDHRGMIDEEQEA